MKSSRSQLSHDCGRYGNCRVIHSFVVLVAEVRCVFVVIFTNIIHAQSKSTIFFSRHCFISSQCAELTVTTQYEHTQSNQSRVFIWLGWTEQILSEANSFALSSFEVFRQKKADFYFFYKVRHSQSLTMKRLLVSTSSVTFGTEAEAANTRWSSCNTEGDDWRPELRHNKLFWVIQKPSNINFFNPLTPEFMFWDLLELFNR